VWPFARVVGTDTASVSLLAREGILGPQFADPDTRVSHRAVVNMLERAVAATGDHHLGLHAAEATELTDLDPVDHAARTCANLGDALRCLSRYFALIDDSAELALDVTDGRATFSYGVVDGLREPAAIAEFALARILLFVRRNAVAEESGWEVWFTHRAPADVGEHHRVLRLPVRFAAPRSAIVLPATSLEVPMRYADVGLAKSFAARAKQLLAKLATTDDVALRVRRIATQQITVSMAAVARQLGASVATLRRQLAAEGTSFRRVMEDLRRDLAEQALRDGSCTCSEVASKLGFADVAAFHRAFRRWTGLAPTAYRDQHRSSRARSVTPPE
jgi:AraC-like DNA-binding protein